MRKGKLITITLLVVMLLVSIMPSFGVQAATQTSITFDSNLYNAIKASLQLQGVSANYNDAQNTITIDEGILNSITTLKLSNFGIDDLTGLENFTSVTSLDLSANELTSESNLGVLNSMNLTYLDLSSNAISDLSEVTDISNVETLNLHNQKFNQAVIIDNSIVKNGTIEYECELPQIIQAFANPLSAEWLVPEINDYSTSNFRFLWTASGVTKLRIGERNGTVYTGLATLKIKVTDVNSPLYNSEINLYYVVINEDQRGIEIKDRHLYEAIKAQLTKDQSINSNLTDYTNDSNLYDKAYDEQMIFVINENDLVNKIQSLVLDNDRISDLTGIEKFIGLKDELDLSSNYIDSIKRIVELQENKDEEEKKLQERVKNKIAQLKERLEKLDALQAELENTVKAYNEVVGRYNAIVNATDKSNAATQENALLETIKTNAAKYVELSGNNINIFGTTYSSVNSINNITDARDVELSELDIIKYPNAGTIGAVKSKVESKTIELFETYKESHLLVTFTNNSVKKMTEEEIRSLSLEEAKSVLQAQVSKLTSLEAYLTEEEKDNLKLVYPSIDFDGESKTPIKDYFTEYLKDLEETEAGVSVYTNEILKILQLDNESVDNAKTKYNEFIENGIRFDEDLVALTNRIVREDEIEAYVLLPRLDSLDMSQNLIENIDEIAVLKELKTLKFSDNEIVNINNVDWAGFENLLVLDLSFNNISEINALEVLTKIQELDLAKNLISGKIIFNITGMENLEKLDLSSNQIDDIENIISQFEFIAKNYDMEAGEYLVSEYAPEISFKNQNLQMNIKVEKQNEKISVELPMIFRQLESLQWDRTAFGTTSYYGNVTNDGKAVILDVSNVGEKTAIVTVLGNEVRQTYNWNGTTGTTTHYLEGIGVGTRCTIYCNVVEKLEEPKNEEPTNEEPNNEEPTNEEPNNEEPTNEEPGKTEELQVVITINTVSSSAVSAVKNVNNTNYLLVKPNTKVSEVLNEININNSDYSVVLKDATATNELNASDELKTNTVLTVNGLEDKINCIIVVKGDVTGDGEVSISDVLKANQYRNNKIELTDAEFLAGNVVDSNDEIGIEDVLKLNQYRLNKIDTL